MAGSMLPVLRREGRFNRSMQRVQLGSREGYAGTRGFSALHESMYDALTLMLDPIVRIRKPPIVDMADGLDAPSPPSVVS